MYLFIYLSFFSVRSKSFLEENILCFLLFSNIVIKLLLLYYIFYKKICLNLIISLFVNSLVLFINYSPLKTFKNRHHQNINNQLIQYLVNQ